jgi:hypothetical protein
VLARDRAALREITRFRGVKHARKQHARERERAAVDQLTEGQRRPRRKPELTRDEGEQAQRERLSGRTALEGDEQRRAQADDRVRRDAGAYQLVGAGDRTRPNQQEAEKCERDARPRHALPKPCQKQQRRARPEHHERVETEQPTCPRALVGGKSRAVHGQVPAEQQHVHREQQPGKALYALGRRAGQLGVKGATLGRRQRLLSPTREPSA